MDTSPTASWSTPYTTDISQAPRLQRDKRPSTPGPSRYRPGVPLSNPPPVPALQRSASHNPFGDTLERNHSISSRRESLHLHPSVTPRTGARSQIVPFQLDGSDHRGVAAPWWQRSIEVPVSTSNIALIVGSFGCLLGVIALGVAVRADTRDPIGRELHNSNSTLALAIVAYVRAVIDAQRNVTGT